MPLPQWCNFGATERGFVAWSGWSEARDSALKVSIDAQGSLLRLSLPARSLEDQHPLRASQREILFALPLGRSVPLFRMWPLIPRKFSGEFLHFGLKTLGSLEPVGLGTLGLPGKPRLPFEQLSQPLLAIGRIQLRRREGRL